MDFLSTPPPPPNILNSDTLFIANTSEAFFQWFSGETYTTVFSIIKDKMESLGMSIEIQTLRSDFKTAAYSSIRSLFPGLGADFGLCGGSDLGTCLLVGW